MSAPKDEYEGRGAFAGGLLVRLLAFAQPHWRLLGGALCLFPLVAALQIAQPYVIKQAIDGPISEGRPDALLNYAA